MGRLFFLAFCCEMLGGLTLDYLKRAAGVLSAYHTILVLAPSDPIQGSLNRLEGHSGFEAFEGHDF